MSPSQKNRGASFYLLLAFLNIVNMTHFFLNYSRVCKCLVWNTTVLEELIYYLAMCTRAKWLKALGVHKNHHNLYDILKWIKYFWTCFFDSQCYIFQINTKHNDYSKLDIFKFTYLKSYKPQLPCQNYWLPNLYLFLQLYLLIFRIFKFL